MSSLKSLNFERPNSGVPNFIFSSLVAYPEIVMCLAHTIKKIEVWCRRLRETPDCGPPKFCHIYLYKLYLRNLKILSVQHKWLNFKFWHLCLREVSSFWYPQFCQILSFCYIF